MDKRVSVQMTHRLILGLLLFCIYSDSIVIAQQNDMLQPVSSKDTLLIQAIRNTYQQIDTYQDSTIIDDVTININSGREPRSSATSKRYFIRDGNYKYSYFNQNHKYARMYYSVDILHDETRKSSVISIKRGEQTPEINQKSFDNVIAYTTGITKSDTLMTPKLLLDTLLSGRHLFEYISSFNHIGTDTIDGKLCNKIHIESIISLDKKTIKNLINNSLNKEELLEKSPSGTLVIEEDLWFNTSTHLLVKKSLRPLVVVQFLQIYLAYTHR